ncbi:putative DNA-binding transcriptional regulator YafY [Actinocorallia herbida]|uniref:Putative DNA-binding transcriptional regulator YafY n=1 Tax=Actinocorallia herbida TaxID=58109 RepID=A0A3N1CSH6_9ACTN|nr:WYL domain-containing protein [Actinocorallia herbida]ROO84260.1 putative DNA-binding transcriptional regulator YafY [Actinocorallia herbida]
MRADRLLAALMLFQSRGRMTAADLAAELDVSLATARRDLEALAAAGVPVYPQPGRGGGWALVGGARTDLSGLTSGETQALFLLLGPASSASAEAKAALRKLTGALPTTFRADARAASDAVVVDPVSWGGAARSRPPLVAVLQSAVVRRRRIRLAYAARTGPPSDRLVSPWGLIDKDEVWYLIAGTDQGRRTFRVDRVLSAALTEEPFAFPDDFTLAQAWREVVEEIEGRRARTWATVATHPSHLPVLRTHFGRHCHPLPDPPSPDLLRIRVAAPTPLDLARSLAGWGALLEVLDPPSVRAELARIGAELGALYEPGPS